MRGSWLAFALAIGCAHGSGAGRGEGSPLEPNRAIVGRGMRAHRREIVQCLAGVKESGTMVVTFDLRTDGRPENVRARGLGNGLTRDCVTRVVAGIVFERPAARVRVDYPLHLRIWGP